ncbi:MAG: hypothetical protein ACKO38_03790 [Planctomycetota bacterium]
MSQTRANTLRLAALLGFIAGMPVLAIPAVNNSLDEWLFPAALLVDTLPLPIAEVSPSHTPSPSNSPLWSPSQSSPTSPPIDPLNMTPAVSAAGSLAVSPADLRSSDSVARLPPADIPVTTSRFETIQRRLQELGAVYFRLEDTGETPGRYRFRCELPLPGNATYLRPFEHEDADPDRAMQAVLDEVELWLAAKRMRPMRKAAVDQ